MSVDESRARLLREVPELSVFPTVVSRLHRREIKDFNLGNESPIIVSAEAPESVISKFEIDFMSSVML